MENEYQKTKENKYLKFRPQREDYGKSKESEKEYQHDLHEFNEIESKLIS